MIVESRCLTTRAGVTVVIRMDTISSSDTLITEAVVIEVEGNACTSGFSSLYIYRLVEYRLGPCLVLILDPVHSTGTISQLEISGTNIRLLVPVPWYRNLNLPLTVSIFIHQLTCSLSFRRGQQ